MRNQHTPKMRVIKGDEYLEFRQTLTTLWQAQAMAEIITSADAEKLDSLVIQTAVRGIGEFLLKSVMTLEELGVDDA
ncbi:hypothetical protein [Frederiksenia canicola]